MFMQEALAARADRPTTPLVPSPPSRYLEVALCRWFTPLPLLLAVLAGCGGGDGPSEPAQPVFTSLTLTASVPTIFTRPPGTTATLTARAYDQNGNPMSGLGNPSFTSDNGRVASVDASGLVTAVASGTTTLTASLTANGETRTASVYMTVTEGERTAMVTAPGVVFTPQQVNLVQGGSVTWAFQGTPHNVVFSGEGAPADIRDPLVNASDTRTFPNRGTFRYECLVHAPLMWGEIVVR